MWKFLAEWWRSAYSQLYFIENLSDAQTTIFGIFNEDIKDCLISLHL